MFRMMINEARLEFTITTASPLAIRSGMENVLEPARPDMQCVRAWHDGVETVYIPGSSLKGVLRSRAEQIINLLGGKACNCTQRKSSCSGEERDLKGLDAAGRYRSVCKACQLFGSTLVAGRVAFPDAFPVGTVKTGERAGVGINRLTGGAQHNALFQQEVVEDGSFRAALILTNYELWQLRLLLWVLRDLDDGYVALGGGSTRGLGRVHIGPVTGIFRDYRSGTERPQLLRGRLEDDRGGALHFNKGAYYWEARLETGLPELEQLLATVDVRAAMVRGDRDAR